MPVIAVDDSGMGKRGKGKHLKGKSKGKDKNKSKNGDGRQGEGSRQQPENGQAGGTVPRAVFSLCEVVSQT